MTETRARWAEVHEATELALVTVGRLPHGAQTHPSLCQGWTRGHVLTHLARNADALGNLVTWALSGVPTPMYTSLEAREAAIASGATRPMSELAADVQESAARLAELAARLSPEHDEVQVEVRGGWWLPARKLARLRLREVCYHHVDLDAGFGFADLTSDHAARFLADEVTRLRSHPEAPALTMRSDEGDDYTIGDGTAYVTGSRAAILGWVARGLTAGMSGDGCLPTLPKGA